MGQTNESEVLSLFVVFCPALSLDADPSAASDRDLREKWVWL
jgi:hypothetical protein